MHGLLTLPKINAVTAFTQASPPCLPLCVDLDGTLIKTDTLLECLLLLLKRNVLWALLLPVWLWRGRAYCKQEICRRVELDAALLPYNKQVLAFVRGARRAGRSIFLVTGADRRIAQKIAAHLDCFDGVLASDGITNLTGSRKAACLVQKFGAQGFDYAGDSANDLWVWKQANRAIVVNASARLIRQAHRLSHVESCIEERYSLVHTLPRALRVHQWVKNLLIFVPLLTSHRLTELSLIGSALCAFIAFSLCASSVYLLNDSLDLQADRRHEKKRRRPLAAGDLSLAWGLALMVLLLGSAAAIACLLPTDFLIGLSLYYVLTLAYSLYFKRKLLLDVYFLGGLYTIRVLAGNAATGVTYSPWLLAFSMFLFVSLAFVKRVAEFDKEETQDLLATSGRGYRVLDRHILLNLGTASGMLCVLVLALYINSPQVEPLYKTPILLWLLCPLVMYWVSRVWVITCRGKMHGDPVVFALRDGVSYAVGLCAAVIIFAATLSWPI